MQFLLALLSTILNYAKRDEEDVLKLQRVVQGEESALAELYDQYGQLLYSLGMRILRSVGEAEDTVQDVFIQVWKKASTYEKSKGTVYTWIVTMMRNRCIDRLRSKGFRYSSQQLDLSTLVLAADSPSSNPYSKTVSNEHQQLILGTLKALTIDQQHVLALSYYEGYSQSEIADKLKIPLGTVKSRMMNGLLTMRSMLKEKL